MLNRAFYALAALSFTLVSFASMAHEGHDHSHPSAGLIHLLWAAPVLIVGAVISYKLRKKQLEKRNKDNV